MSSTLAAAAVAAGVRDERVVSALHDVPRTQFVPRGHIPWADIDQPIPIGHGQVTTQPSLVAAMVEAVGLEGNEMVLEVGTGYGYQTAILARLAAFVWSVEWWPDLAAIARSNLEAAAVSNVEVTVGDGTLGLPEHSPFDAIIVAAAYPEVPPPLVEQLAPGGRLVQPIGPGGREDVVVFEKRDDRLVQLRVVIPARFVRLQGVHGYHDEPES